MSPRPGGRPDLQLTLDNVSLLEALAFRDRYPDAYAQVVAWAHEDAQAQGWCGMKGYLEALRSTAISRRLGLRRVDDEPFRINNNLGTPLVRLILSEHPHLPFRRRSSKCDPTPAELEERSA